MLASPGHDKIGKILFPDSVPELSGNHDFCIVKEKYFFGKKGLDISHADNEAALGSDKDAFVELGKECAQRSAGLDIFAGGVDEGIFIEHIDIDNGGAEDRGDAVVLRKDQAVPGERVRIFKCAGGGTFHACQAAVQSFPDVLG